MERSYPWGEPRDDDFYDDDCGDYVDCWNCGGEGFSSHDCGEDTCCCLHPEDNVVCDVCEGKGGWPRPITTDTSGAATK